MEAEGVFRRLSRIEMAAQRGTTEVVPLTESEYFHKLLRLRDLPGAAFDKRLDEVA
jgi:hypothetical protein